MAEEKKAVIPYDLLSKEDAEKIKVVVTKRSFVAKLKGVEFVGTEKIYQFLLNRMVFSADAVRALRIEDYVVKDNGDGTYTADDQAGATGIYRRVFESPGKHIYVAVGQYKGSWIRLQGRAVAVLEFKEIPGKKMVNWLHLYFKFDNVVVGAFVKVVSPLIGPLLDKKVGYFVGATQKLCRRITEDPQGVYETLKKSKDISQQELEEFKKEFLK